MAFTSPLRRPFARVRSPNRFHYSQFYVHLHEQQHEEHRELQLPLQQLSCGEGDDSLMQSQHYESSANDGAPSNHNIRDNFYIQEHQLNFTLDGKTLIVAARGVVNGPTSSINTPETIICEGYLSRSCNYESEFEIHMMTTSKYTDNMNLPSLDEFIAVFHRLLLEYLSYEQLAYEHERDDNHGHSLGDTTTTTTSLKVLINDNDIDTEFMTKLQNIGFFFLPNEDTSNNNQLGFELESYHPFLNEYVLRHRGTEYGNESLNVIKMLCRRRVPYNFASNDNNHDSSSTVVSLQKDLLPLTTVQSAMEIIDEIKSQQMLSMNPDSVDGLPSLHLNLISNGEPLFDSKTLHNNDENEKEDTTSMSFAECISRLTEILQSHL